MSTQPSTQFLNRPGGRIAFDVSGHGPLVVLVPGMGDLRSTYRHLAPALLAAGYRVASTDLRGHGDSDPTFAEYGDQPTADDILALVAQLGGPAIIVGNSMGAGAAVLAAAEAPGSVRGVVLVGPFVRDPDVGLPSRLLLRVAMARPWGSRAWRAYLPKLYAGRVPEDLDAHLEAISASLRRPGYARAFWATTRQTTHAPVAARLADVAVPALVVMGELDPDWPDPAAEAEWVSQAIRADLVMVADAGHYPQSQQPHATASAILGFLAKVAADA